MGLRPATPKKRGTLILNPPYYEDPPLQRGIFLNIAVCQREFGLSQDPHPSPLPEREREQEKFVLLPFAPCGRRGWGMRGISYPEFTLC